MPRVDPVTGCTVMTLPEFWASEAEAEGKGRSGGEVAADFYSELEDADERDRQRLREPAVALEALRDAVLTWNSEDPDVPGVPVPAEVLQVLDVDSHSGGRTSRVGIKARVRAEDGSTGIVTWGATHTAGSMLEPPDYDCNVQWEPA